MDATRRRDELGFTLVEMLVAIAILGILAGVAVFALGGSAEQSKGASCKADVKTVQAAVDAHALDNDGTFPADAAELVKDGYLRSEPSVDGYTFSVNAKTGEVTASPTCA